MNLNSINKTEQDIISSHDVQFKMLMAAIRDGNVKALKERVVGYELEKNLSFIARYAATIGSEECFEFLLKTQLFIHRPDVLVACLTGNNAKCIELFGKPTEEELSALAFAVAAFKGNDKFIEDNIVTLINTKEYSEYNLVSIAAREGHVRCLEILLDAGFDFNAYDALVTAGANQDEKVILTLLESPFFTLLESPLFTLLESPLFDHGTIGDAVVDAAIVASTYGNHKTLAAIFDNYGNYFNTLKDFAVGKSAIFSESIDTVQVYIDNGGTFEFDNVMSIVAGLAGEPLLVESNKTYRGNLELFKLVESIVKPSADELKGLPLKTAKAYCRKDIVEYIESK